MSWLSSMFKGKKKQKSSSQSSSDYADFAKEGMHNAFEDATRLYEEGKRRGDDGVYNGQRIIDDFSPETNDLISKSKQNVDNTSHLDSDLSDLRSGTVSPYLQQKMDTDSQNLKQRLQNDASLGGMGSSNMAQLLANTLGEQRNSALNTAWDKQQDRRLQAYQLEDAHGRNQSANINDALAASGKKDALRQMQLNSAEDAFNERKNAQWENLAKYLAAGKTITAGTGQQQSSGTAQISGGGLDAGGLLGGLGSAVGAAGKAGLFTAAFSDDRVKWAIEDTGRKTKDGIPIKRFNYVQTSGKSLPAGRFEGVLASDVAKKRPEAVSKTGAGIWLVDYGKLGIKVKRVSKNSE